MLDPPGKRRCVAVVRHTPLNTGPSIGRFLTSPEHKLKFGKQGIAADSLTLESVPDPLSGFRHKEEDFEISNNNFIYCSQNIHKQ